MHHPILDFATNRAGLVPVPSSSDLDTATLDLLASWRAEDATDDAEELRLAEVEIAAFMKAMNDNRSRTGEGQLYL